MLTRGHTTFVTKLRGGISMSNQNNNNQNNNQNNNNQNKNNNQKNY